MTVLAGRTLGWACGMWRGDVARTAGPVAALCAGGAISWAAWLPDGPVGLIALLPLLWTLQGGRGAAGLVWLGYFLAGSRDLPAVVARFFPGEPWAFGLTLWLIDAAILALPWVLLWPNDRATAPAVWLRTVAAIVLLSVPPIGLLSWLSPLLAGGVLFPGWGWSGIAGIVLLSGVLAVVGHALRLRNVSLARAGMVPIVGLLVAAAGANLAYRSPPPPDGWVAIDTRFGRFPADAHAAFRRQNDLMQIATEAIEAGAKVVVLPEEVAGTWRPAVEYWWRRVDDLAARHGATVLVGADVPLSTQRSPGTSSRFTDSLVMLGATRGRVDARVPVPFSSWRPWANRGAVADVAGSGIIELHGMSAAMSICYEDFLAWPAMLSLARRPQVVISAANNWFAEGLVASSIQRRSVDVWAKAFGVPLIRATNTSP